MPSNAGVTSGLRASLTAFLLFAATQSLLPRAVAAGVNDPSAEIGVVTTLAGTAGSGGHTDGIGGLARFLSPKAMSTDQAGNIYTVDNFCGTLRKITPNGEVTTLAGPVNGCAFGNSDGTGDAARFNRPSGTTADSAGNIYVADSGNCTLRKVTPDGVVTTLAGSPSVCVSIDGTKDVARFNFLAGVAADLAGNIYVTSWNDCTVRRVNQAGTVTTIAGVSGLCSSVDGSGTDARFGNPSGIAMDSTGNFFIADETGCTIRKMTPTGAVTTLAGNAGNCASADGTGGDARFNVPSWTAVDPSGNVYVSDYLNFTVRAVSPAGVVTTLAGLAGTIGSADGRGIGAQFNHPDGIAADTAGNIYVADRNNNTVRKIVTPNYVPPCQSNQSASLTVARGPFRTAPKSTLYSQQITFTNSGSSSITGPFSIVFDALPSGVTVVNPSGVTSCAAPAGRPWIAASTAPVSLPFGQSFSVTVTFNRAGSAGITYTPVVFAGGGGQ